MGTINDQLAAKKAAAEDLVARIRGGEASEEDYKSLDTLLGEAEELGRRIKAADEADQKMGTLGVPRGEQKRKEEQKAAPARSLGDHFVQGMGAKGVLSTLKGGNRLSSVDLPEYGEKAAGDVQVTGNSIGADHLAQPDIDTNIVGVYTQRPTIADWLGAGTIASNAIVYFLEKPWDTAAGANGNFGTVAENAQKPGMTAPDYEEVTETLKKIAGWIKVSMEMAEDHAFLVSEINNRLLYQLLLFEEDQLLNGNGTGTNVLGLLNREGVQVASAENFADNMDAIFRANSDVFIQTGLRADGIVIHPANYRDLRLIKDANGQYLAGGPFSGQYGSAAGVLQDPPLWGIPTIQTTAVPQNLLVLGAGKQAATVYRKGGIRVEASNADGQDFTHNRFTILAEERLTLAVRRPNAFVKLTLAPKSAPAG